MEFKELIRDIPDFPKEGICFRDITTLLQHGKAFHEAVSLLAVEYKTEQVDLVVAPEARGFIIGTAVAYDLKAGLVPVRKPGKLPSEVISQRYMLEYGEDSLEIHKDAIVPGQKVIIVDDLLATGGTTKAVIKLIEHLGGQVVGISFLIELENLKGRDALAGYKVTSLIKY